MAQRPTNKLYHQVFQQKETRDDILYSSEWTFLYLIPSSLSKTWEWDSEARNALRLFTLWPILHMPSRSQGLCLLSFRITSPIRQEEEVITVEREWSQRPEGIILRSLNLKNVKTETIFPFGIFFRYSFRKGWTLSWSWSSELNSTAALTRIHFYVQGM